MAKNKNNKKSVNQKIKKEITSDNKTKIQTMDKAESDDEIAEETQMIHSKQPSFAFALLRDEDDGNDDTGSQSDQSDSEPEQIVQKKTVAQAKNVKKQPPVKKGGKKEEEEDFDEMLRKFSGKPITTAKAKTNKKATKEELPEESKVSVEPPQQLPEIRADMTADELAQIFEQMNPDDEEEGRKKKKKQPKKVEKESPKSDLDDDDDEEEEEGGSTMKTAAQKKKEKKERQKAEKLTKAKQVKAKPTTQGKKEGTPDAQEAPEKEVETPSVPEPVDDGKKDKKKKKGDAKEEEKPKKSKFMVNKILEAQKFQKEEEERLKKEEEEKLRLEEEEQRLREEQEQLEKERKERKKQKEKDRVKRLKAEGKFKTDKQKEDNKRAQQMLETYKAQGVPTPLLKDSVAEEDKNKPKKVVYASKPKKKLQPSSSTASAATPPTEIEATPLLSQPPNIVVKEESDDDVKENWDDTDEEEEVHDVATSSEVTVSETSQPSNEEKDDDDNEDVTKSHQKGAAKPHKKEVGAAKPHKKGGGKTAQENATAQVAEVTEANTIRAPVICVLGHVDTGKTKILDMLRKSQVQAGEAGGITQQIGATNVPHEAIRGQTRMCKEFDLKLPGILLIDTPGHESFNNLRLRGSTLCDIAILVVDIMHGLEPQTIESIEILKEKKLPFVVALNKIDRINGWQTGKNEDIAKQIRKQKPNTKCHFNDLTKRVMLQFSEKGLNSCLYYENKNPKEFVSLVPTSAMTGDGLGNLIALICTLTQTLLIKKLMFTEDLSATVMEVKATGGHGTTLDVIVLNGRLTTGSTIVVAGQEGPIVTQIRSLLLPPPMHEIRVKSTYESKKEVVAAQGCKIAAKDLEKAIAGEPLYVANNPDEIERYKDRHMEKIRAFMNSMKISERGVYVQASTLGSLEALLSFLEEKCDIPCSGVNIGPVHKKDIMKAMAMLEHDPQFACILAFDVKVEKDAHELADKNKIKIFQADIIYHLQDQFIKYRQDYIEQKRDEVKHVVMFPCKLRILPENVFKSRDPIVVGVVVEAGFVKEGTILCCPSKNFIDVGRVSGIEINHRQVPRAEKGQEVCIKIEAIPGEAPKLYGRHFDFTDELVSKMSRASIDAVKEWFRDEMKEEDWNLMRSLKTTFGII